MYSVCEPLYLLCSVGQAHISYEPLHAVAAVDLDAAVPTGIRYGI